MDPVAGQPEKVGPYRLEQRLGAGGMGAVWRAWDERLKRPVAIKKILPEAKAHPAARARFRREAEAAARLNHPAIVHVYDILDIEDDDWLVMELVEGPTLRDILREGPLDPLRAVRLGRQIAEGLAEAHAHGIIHRDLKAGNVMLTDSGFAKLVDFGIAKQIGPEDQETTLSPTGFVVGTSYAMSPEQVQGLPLDARSDLFSLGSLLYEMLADQAPFLAETPAVTLARVCTFRQRPLSKLLSDIPQELSDLVDRLLEKDPVDRPQTAREVAAALERIAVGLRGSSATIPPVELASGESSELETLLEPRAGTAPSIEEASRPEPRQTQVPRGPFRPFTTFRVWAAGALLFALLFVGLLGFGLRRMTVARGQESPYALYQQGMTLLARADKRGHVDEAIRAFRSAINQDQQNAPAHAGLARALWFKFWYENQDRMWLEQGLPIAQRAVELDSYLATARVSHGLILLSLGHVNESRSELERAILLDPLNADAYHGLGKIDESGSRLKEAEEAYKRAISHRNDRLFYDDLGSLYLRTGRIEEAMEAFRSSIALASDGPFGYRNLGVAYYSQGKLAEAAAEFQKALQIQPDYSLYSNLGTIFFAQGLYAQAAAAFEDALKAGASNNHFYWGNLADAYRWIPNPDKAREAYARAIQLLEQNPRLKQDPTLSSRLAMYLAKYGDQDRALAACLEAKSMIGNDANAWFRLAVAYEVVQERESAIAALSQALQSGFSFAEVQGEPELIDLRQDPSYHRLLARARMP